MCNWTFRGKPFLPDHAEDYFGFVYLITHVPTGRKYVGKKFFSAARTRRTKKSARKRHFRVPSDWQEYWGSNKDLCAEVERRGKQEFTREILHLCSTRGECQYRELEEQITRQVLFSDDYYNQWISAKIHKICVRKFV